MTPIHFIRQGAESNGQHRSRHIEKLRDPDYMPPAGAATPPGMLHVLAMFTSHVTPAIILNLILPKELAGGQTEEMSGGMAGHGDHRNA